jgi:diguanylate cyclase (GGDEF)-like protein/PAS domain S-box-containing protein
VSALPRSLRQLARHHRAARLDDTGFRAIVTHAPIGILESRTGGQIISVNPALCAMLGYQSDELVGQQASAISDPRDVEQQTRDITSLANGSDGFVSQRRYRRKDGSSLAVLVSANAVRRPSGVVELLICTIVDVSEQVAGQRALETAHAEIRDAAMFHDAVLAASPDLIFVIDAETSRNVWSSKNLVEMLGYSEQQMRGFGQDTVSALVHPDDRAEVVAANVAAQSLPDGDVVAMRYRVLNVDGRYRWLARRITPFTRDESGRVTQVLGVARDITDVVQVEERLANAALHDPLTGLPNRILLTDRLRSALDRSKRSGTKLAVLFCDLDGFKQVNDSGGHAAGDAVLKETALRLRTVLRAEDTAARIGGDEFVIILEPAGRPPVNGEKPVDAGTYGTLVAERIRRALAEPVEFDGASRQVTVSIGMTIARSGGVTETILQEADAAMYQAKNQGKNRCARFGEAPPEAASVTKARQSNSRRSSAA